MVILPLDSLSMLDYMSVISTSASAKRLWAAATNGIIEAAGKN